MPYVDLRKTRFIQGAEYTGTTLVVTFTNGSIRAYKEVPGNIWAELNTATSPGKVYMDKIKKHYTVVIMKEGAKRQPKKGDQTKLFFAYGKSF